MSSIEYELKEIFGAESIQTITVEPQFQQDVTNLLSIMCEGEEKAKRSTFVFGSSYTC